MHNKMMTKAIYFFLWPLFILSVGACAHSAKVPSPRSSRVPPHEKGADKIKLTELDTELPREPSNPWEIPKKLRLEPDKTLADLPIELEKIRKDIDAEVKDNALVEASDCVPKLNIKPLPLKCPSKEDAKDKLFSGLQQYEGFPHERERFLAGIETCQTYHKVAVRLLRAEVLESRCRDVYVDPLIDEWSRSRNTSHFLAPLSPTLSQTLIAYKLEGIFSKIGTSPPEIGPPLTKERVREFIAGDYATWFRHQTSASQNLAIIGKTLNGYARAIVALASAQAELRLIEATRKAPLANEYAGDTSLKEEYESHLDEVLEPRKKRARDALLVSLNDFANLGFTEGARIETARRLLHDMFAGSRILVLDKLIFPPWKTNSHRYRDSSLNVFYKELAQVNPAEFKRSRGGDDLSYEASNMDTIQEEVTHHFRMAQVYFRMNEADKGIAKLILLPKKTPGSELALATLLAMRKGPTSLSQLVISTERREESGVFGFRHTQALDALAMREESQGQHSQDPHVDLDDSASAAYNAALLLESFPREDAGKDYFEEVKKRYELAMRKTYNTELRKKAEQGLQHAKELIFASQKNR